MFPFIFIQSLFCGLPCRAFLKGNGGLSLIHFPPSLELAEEAFVVIDRHIISLSYQMLLIISFLTPVSISAASFCFLLCNRLRNNTALPFFSSLHTDLYSFWDFVQFCATNTFDLGMSFFLVTLLGYLVAGKHTTSPDCLFFAIKHISSYLKIFLEHVLK